MYKKYIHGLVTMVTHTVCAAACACRDLLDQSEIEQEFKQSFAELASYSVHFSSEMSDSLHGASVPNVIPWNKTQ